MKTSREIEEAITKKEKELTDWAIKLIDETSETMFKDALKSSRIRIDFGETEKFKIALDTPAVKKVLKENGFEVSTQGWDFYLIFK